MCEGGSDTVEVRVLDEERKWKTVKSDSCIAPLIEMLNKCRIRTISCCCGHGGVGYLIVAPENVSLSWKMNENREPEVRIELWMRSPDTAEDYK